MPAIWRPFGLNQFSRVPTSVSPGRLPCQFSQLVSCSELAVIQIHSLIVSSKALNPFQALVNRGFVYATKGDYDRAIHDVFPGGYFKEFIFFHRASKTLILADTIINLELDKVAEPWRTATKLKGLCFTRHSHGG